MSRLTVEVDAVCDWAKRHQRPPVAEVAAHFRITHTLARERVKYAQATARRRELKPAPVAVAALACGCGERFPIDAAKLTRHTLEAHHRTPSRTERTPVAA